jgi:hypothetical protein
LKLVGLQTGKKQTVLMHVVLRKLLEEYLKTKKTFHIVYVDSDSNFPLSAINKIILYLVNKLSKKITKEELIKIKSILEESIFLYKINQINIIHNLLENEINSLLDPEKSGLNVKFHEINFYLNFVILG